MVCSAEADQKEHQDRLDQVIQLCGMTRLSVTGDGNCCFIAIAEALGILYNNSSTNIERDMKSLPVNFGSGDTQVNQELRELVQEWIEHNIYYQDFLSEGTVQEEASKFLVNDFFFCLNLEIH